MTGSLLPEHRDGLSSLQQQAALHLFLARFQAQQRQQLHVSLLPYQSWPAVLSSLAAAIMQLLIQCIQNVVQRSLLGN